MSYFLWPEGTFSRFGHLFRSATAEEVEFRLQSMYPSGYPVLVSSGRAAIRLVHSLMGISRGDCIGVPRYASHCVLDVVARSAAPVLYQHPGTRKSDLVYHPWGYLNAGEWMKPIIEDAVDTLLVPGNDLFQVGGDFEIWSLPKILGTSSGGVIWCREASDAESLRRLRSECSGGFAFWLLRQMGHFWHALHVAWSGLESHQGGDLAGIVCAEVLNALGALEALIEERKLRWTLVEKLIPDWAHLGDGRLPCCVPLEVKEEIVTSLSELGFSAGFRILEIGDSFHRIFALPIHQDVPERLIRDALALFDDCEK